MSKKIITTVAITVVAYLSLWAWSIHWIDSHNTHFKVSDSSSFEKNTLTIIAKTVWKITPAINREKDAKRALKVYELFVYQDMGHYITNSKLAYNDINLYYNKHKNKLNEYLQNQFILQKLIFMNRSWHKIEDEPFKKEIRSMIFNEYKTNFQMNWLSEIIWFITHDCGYDNSYNYDICKESLHKYTSDFEKNVRLMNEQHHTSDFDHILMYLNGTIKCSAHIKGENVLPKELLIEADKSASEYFKILQNRVNKENFEVISKFIVDHSNFLTLLPIILDEHETSECRKEVLNFSKKMDEMEK